MDTPDTKSLLQLVDFGRYDAERDENIADYFVRTGTAESVTKGKSLVIGRKGSGKTALFRHVAATHSGDVIELDLEQYVFKANQLLKEGGVPEALAYASSWRLTIAAATYVQIRSKLRFRDRWRGDRILRRLGRGANKPSVGAILDWLRRVRRVELPSIPGFANLGAMELADTTRGVLDHETSRLLSDLEELIFAYADTNSLVVLIDRLDDAWDGSLDSLRLIGGAVRAARHYSNRLAKPNTIAPVIVFLRTDLWDAIEFNDKNKASQDVIFLDWTEPELSSVIDERIRASTGLSSGEGWKAIFTQEEMRQRASSQRYMLKRTLGRPRDIIAFAAFAQERALTNGHTRVESQDIYEAEIRFSKHLLDELRDEIGHHVADMTSVINAIKALRRRTFTLSDWERVSELNGIAPEAAQTVLDLLFEASAVGVHRTGGSRGGSSTVYRYQDRFLKATDTGSLQVHLGLVKELALTDR